MTEPSYRPVVALELDGVLRIPGGHLESGTLGDTRRLEVTMRRRGFPTYSHLEPPWDPRGDWTGSHSFSGAAVEWVRALLARGCTVTWVSSWGGYVNVYFADALGLPMMPFMDWAVGAQEHNRHLVVARWLSQRFAGRPLLWVCADVDSADVAALRSLRTAADRARTRVFVPDRSLGVTATDAGEMDAWLEAAESEEGQEEFRRRDRRRQASRRAELVRDRWGTPARYRRWLSARRRLEPVLGSDNELLVLLADYVLEFGDKFDANDVAQIRERWGRATDPPVEALVALLRPTPGRPMRTTVLTWAGHGYPPGLGGLLSRGHASGIRTLDVGRGWWPLLVRLDDQLARIDPVYTVIRLRSVDGRLRFEAESSQPIWFRPVFGQIIRAAQQRAARTCERCGRNGRRRDGEGTRATVLCDAHARPLTDEEVTFALAGGVPPEIFALDGEIEATVSAQGWPGDAHPVAAAPDPPRQALADLAQHSEHYVERYLEDLREGWPE